MLNCYDTLKDTGDYSVYVQNVDAGVYIIVAKQVKIER